MNNLDAEVDAFLEHFGVRGMRWGVRNKEKSGEKQVRREEKAKQFEGRADLFQKKINELSVIQPRTPYQANAINQQIQVLSKEKNRALNDAKAKREGKLTSTQKRVIIGASVVTALVAAKITYNQIQSGEAHSLILRGKAFIHGQKGSLWKKNLKLADPNLDADGIMRNVVSHINSPGLGSKMNCRRATYAYEMRRRGFDVAATKTFTGRGQDISGNFNVLHPGTKKFVNPGRLGMGTRTITEFVKGKRGGSKPFTQLLTSPGALIGKHQIPSVEETFHELSKMPNGSRGELGLKWKLGGAHSLAWEVIKGKPVIFDAQSGKKFTEVADFSRNLPHFDTMINDMAFTRLDNVPLNDLFLTRWLKNA